MRYCANCDCEATHLVEETNTPLCTTRATAYEWGQASPDKTVICIDCVENAGDTE